MSVHFRPACHRLLVTVVFHYITHQCMLFVVLPGRDGGTGLLNFKPTPETPSLQYFESVSAGSPAEMAGLQLGDYLLEVMCCVCCNSRFCSVLFCSVLYPSSTRGLATLWTYFLHLSLSSVILIDSSTESPVHVLMLSIQAVHGLPRLHAPFIVPCFISSPGSSLVFYGVTILFPCFDGV